MAIRRNIEKFKTKMHEWPFIHCMNNENVYDEEVFRFLIQNP